MAVLKYYKETYCESDYSCGEWFEFTPEHDDLLAALAQFIWSDYLKEVANATESKFSVLINGLKRFIADNELEESLSEIYYEGLLDWFEEDADEKYEIEGYSL